MIILTALSSIALAAFAAWAYALGQSPLGVTGLHWSVSLATLYQLGIVNTGYAGLTRLRALADAVIICACIALVLRYLPSQYQPYIEGRWDTGIGWPLLYFGQSIVMALTALLALRIALSPRA